MILTKLAMCGFRGTKQLLELTIPNGFLVISGHNGSGKSTICDAIDFALTGRFRSTGHKEKGESIEDYVWWRGAGAPHDRFVALWLLGPNGNEMEVRRTPDGLVNDGDKGLEGRIEDMLCDLTEAPIDPVFRLCQTSIVRDEEITTISVDLPESERYDFVRCALGTTEFGRYEERGRAVQDLLDKRYERARNDYTTLRTKVADLTARLSEMRSETSDSPEVGTAEATVRRLLDLPSTGIRELLEGAAQAMASRRVLIDNLVRLVERIVSVEQRLQQVHGESYRQRIDALTKQVVLLKGDLSPVEERLVNIDREIAQQQQDRPRLTALANLHQSGQRLGLNDGQSCPLCGSTVPLALFEAHIKEIQARLTIESEATVRLVREQELIQQQVAALRGRLDDANGQLRQLENASEQLNRELADARDTAVRLGVSEVSVPINSGEVGRYAEEVRAKYSELERSVALLEVSRTLERITRLEKELEAVEGVAASAEESMDAASKAAHKAKEAVTIIRRMRGEAMDVGLAALSPLMTELYLRLRPHVEWQDISYKLRGDVRKFLRFEVGDGLNPSFVFSSGQRRAAGLAFLLAVYLARPWCKLRTLILDDPVQHVDDFRALNLTEVLGAIRSLGKQIICTTEDSALAELMCRRLRSTGRDAGCLVEMSHNAIRGIHVSTIRTIVPMSRDVLIRA